MVDGSKCTDPHHTGQPMPSQLDLINHSLDGGFDELLGEISGSYVALNDDSLSTGLLDLVDDSLSLL